MQPANKFATALHRNTNRMVFLLIYTTLEWILLFLLLLNALFNYAISKFASLVGLDPPCFLCSRIDHHFEPGKSWCDFLCESHAGEVSKLGKECASLLRRGNLIRGPGFGLEEDAKGAAFSPFAQDVKEDASVAFLAVRVDSKVDSERGLFIESIDSFTMMNYPAPEPQKAEKHLASEEDEKGDDEANCFEKSIVNEICDHEHIVTQFEAMNHKSEINAVESEQIIDSILNLTEAHTTPNYTDSLSILSKRFLLDRREFGDETLYGFTGSDVSDSNLEPGAVVDRLRVALKSEQEALIALHAELEEERNASAIAANQTMAMITRLQEEKSAMQMEAVQYQRMMEEQAEYDQEALQLLNDLMFKREKEKQELEKELDAYRHKVRVYEAIERRKMPSSPEESENDCRNLMEGEEDEEDEQHLITLDDPLADFEEERLSILVQLKALEEKLVRMDDEEDCSVVNLKQEKLFPMENSHLINGECKQSSFDAISLEMGDEPSFSPDSTDASHKKQAIAEEVDHVYQRLHALEADRKFLKHCVSSLKKGDRGMDLLEEIILNLRDLRTVELRSWLVDAY